MMYFKLLFLFGFHRNYYDSSYWACRLFCKLNYYIM